MLRIAVAYDARLPLADLADAGFVLDRDLPGMQVAYGHCRADDLLDVEQVRGVRLVAEQRA